MLWCWVISLQRVSKATFNILSKIFLFSLHCSKQPDYLWVSLLLAYVHGDKKAKKVSKRGDKIWHTPVWPRSTLSFPLPASLPRPMTHSCCQLSGGLWTHSSTPCHCPFAVAAWKCAMAASLWHCHRTLAARTRAPAKQCPKPGGLSELKKTHLQNEPFTSEKLQCISAETGAS